jgi:hypothetical protein
MDPGATRRAAKPCPRGDAVKSSDCTPAFLARADEMIE